MVVLSLISSGYGQEKIKSVKPCEINAYVADEDPNGLNVRAEPDKSGKILSRLIRGGSEISLDIIGTSGSGWVQITNAWHGDKGDVFKDKGWVFANLLATGTRGYPNYNSPAKLFFDAEQKGQSADTNPE